MSANFTVYRRGAAAFTIESRTQGSVRKATSAKYSGKLMNDDSVSLTVLSSVALDFRLRDYIIYKGKPYMLNQMPEVSVDSSKLYTYNVRFEGAMYELGRVAFLLNNAFGYDYYGTLADFGRLIVGNMNRVNRYVVWEEYSQVTATTHIARQSGVTPDGKVIWGNLNGDDPVITASSRTDHMFTSWIETADSNPAPNSNPIGSSRAQGTPPVIKSVHEWKLDFPKRTTTAASYPQPLYYQPDSTPDSNVHWPDPENQAEAQYISAEDYTAAAMANGFTGYTDYVTGPDGTLPVPTTKIECSVSDITAASPIPAPTRQCQSIGDVETVTNHFSYTVTKRTYHLDVQNNIWVLDMTETHRYTQSYRITYTATGTSGSTWQMQNVTPQSGAATSDDLETVENLLSYDSHSCLAVLNDICSQWGGWEWYIDGEECTHYKGEILVNATIHLKRKEQNTTGVTHSMGFGRKGGLSVIKCKYADDSNVPSKVYFYGGTQNLPQYYRNTRLCLPNAEKAGSYIDLTSIEGCPLPDAIANRTCEEVKVFDDIYPANEPFVIGSGWGVTIAVETDNVSGRISRYLQLTIPKAEFFDLTAKWTLNGNPNELVFLATAVINESDYPDYFEWLRWKGEKDVYDTSTHSSPQRERYYNYYVRKQVSKYLTGGESPMFTFQTGKIAGYSLSVHDFSLQTIQGQECWVVILNTVKEDNSETDTTTDENHKYVPNDVVCSAAGDKFIIDNINMPVSYTYYKDGTANDRSAECQLWKAAMDYVNSISEKIDYEIEVAKDYAAKRNFSPSVRDTVCFGNVLAADGASVRSRITELELDIVDGCSYKIVINNAVASSGIRKFRNMVSMVSKPKTR